MENILTTILKDTYTAAALKHRLNILKSYLTQGFFAQQNPPLQMEAKDLIWLKSLPKEFIQNFNKDNIFDIFSQLEKEVSALKILTIYLTFEPDDEITVAIGTRVRKNFTTVSLLDIKYDPNLIAGAALVWNGIKKDYSLRQTLSQKKGLILDSFKKFLR